MFRDVASAIPLKLNGKPLAVAATAGERHAQLRDARTDITVGTPSSATA
jgi:hypothetical protein